ncbi:hypothetical protein EMIHUDRAFT_208328 [Emiliania huxleyi CCMP1516]|uniref:Uncharacterized protein n=2 Tax=Emiliania huxleyi TaxID=2903 RepID=A0A0D3JAD1_EMIH1|nr:hypothetical protein EMIHUDRAFT_208328 [Emiliania huxleyi CCMP1516]EOD20466.1 hypothetical protein EMIHUDRAFT_208328 [Emiliania huxleyi CCMP1516]|eukprot:XP_005772895.1 hypothetical protein EMIHUDRAFT_208328 [Emiliania huxleyi CCMP1516]
MLGAAFQTPKIGEDWRWIPLIFFFFPRITADAMPTTSSGTAASLLANRLAANCSISAVETSIAGLQDDMVAAVCRVLAGDPLSPEAALAFASTCRSVRRAVAPVLAEARRWRARAGVLLKEAHSGAPSLRGGQSCDDLTSTQQLRLATGLVFGDAVVADASICATLAHLIGRRSLDGLEELRIERAADGRDWRPICSALRGGALPKLAFLDLGNNSLGDAFCAALADALSADPAAVLRCVSRLTLSANRIGWDAGAEAMAARGKLGTFRRLEGLYLHGNRALSTAGLDALAARLTPEPRHSQIDARLTLDDRPPGPPLWPDGPSCALPSLQTLTLPKGHAEHEGMRVACSARWPYVQVKFWS